MSLYYDQFRGAVTESPRLSIQYAGVSVIDVIRSIRRDEYVASGYRVISF